MRTVPEWIGSSDDAPVPARVKLRIFEANDGRCHWTGKKIMPGDEWDVEHVIALCNGGQHRESNMAPILREKHPEKTRRDLKTKAKIDRTRKKHLGIKSKSRNPIPGSRDSGWKRRLTSEGPRTERR